MQNHVLMPETSPEKQDLSDFRRRVLTVVLMTAAVVLSIHLVMNAASVLLLLFVSLLLAVALRTATDWLRAHTPLGNKLAFAAVMLLVLLVLGLLIVLVAPDIAQQASDLADQLPQSMEAIEEQLGRYTWGREILRQIPNNVSVSDLDGFVDGSLFGRITGVVSSVSEFVGMFIIIVFTAIFLAVEPKVYADNLLRLFPRGSRPRLREAGAASYKMLQMWLLSRVVSMIVTFTIIYIGLNVIGMPFALTLALIAGLLSFVPTFGPIIALVPALLVGVLQGPTTALYVLALYLASEFVDNYIVSPALQRMVLVLPPALIIVAQVLLGVLTGQVGLLVAAPLVAAVTPLVRILYVEGLLERSPPSKAEQEL